ncbi:MAG: Xaa-Pro dipeptidyl-peptidase [Gemmatimonadota bacterium]
MRFPSPAVFRVRLLALLLASASGLAGVASGQGTNGSAMPHTVPVFVDGQARIVPAFQDTTSWIRQELWVETDFDSDGDGKPDRMHVDVTRPGQTGSEGLKVATVFASSPYFSGTSGPRGSLWDVKQEVGDAPPPRTSQAPPPFQPVHARISRSEINTWVPRGFAVVHSEAPGTGLSQGCPTVGGRPEQNAPKAVIDWLNGRAKGYTTETGNEEVSATNWSTGKVGMTGTSYEGTLPLAAAVTGVKGLEVVIPIAPNTSYYHYYRSNGLVRHPGGWLGEDIDFLYDFIHSGDPATREVCNRTIRDGLFAAGRDRPHGDYNDFWADRDLLTKIKNVKAAVLLSHGLNDWNVVPEHSVRIYEALRKQHTPTALYLHQGGHGGPPPLELMNRWFSHYLYGIDNGVERDPHLYVVRENLPRGAAATAYADYPNPAARPVRLFPSGSGRSMGMLALETVKSGTTESLIDDVQFSGAALAAADSSANRLLFATQILATPMQLSGTVRVTLRLASSKPAANLSIWLVTLPFDATPIGSEGRVGVVTRGWADPQNAESLTQGGNYDSKRPGVPLEAGKFVELTFDLQPDDQVIPAGKRLGVMIFSSDRDFTLWPQSGTELTIDLARSSIELPVVGGPAALRRAIGK